MLIPDGESPFALFALHGFIDHPQVKVYVLSNQRWPPTRLSRYCHKFIYERYAAGAGERIQATAEAVERYAIDVVLPVEMGWIASQDEMRHALSERTAIVPVLDSRSFRMANNKWLLVQLMQKLGLPTIPTVLCTLDDGFEPQLRRLDFPVLLKPVASSGGEGIRRFDTLPQLWGFLERCDPGHVKDRYLVQSFLEGYVIGLNLLCRDGQVLAHTIQRGFLPNRQAYAMARGIRFVEDGKALAAGTALAAGLRYNGVANLDTLYDTREDRIKILELNPRFWGSLRGSYAAGVNFPYLACLAALKMPLPTPGYQLTRYVHPKAALREGILRPFGRSPHERFPLEETGLKYVLADPLAETVRGLLQELDNICS